jgi:AcrR family transcriptional regulator
MSDEVPTTLTADDDGQTSEPGEAGERPAKEDGRVSRAQRLRQERRTQVHLVAQRLFAERGYHETSIQDILDAADIARGTFYLYFDSKRAIFDELVDGFLQRIRSVVTRIDVRPEAPPPLMQIEQNLIRVMDILRENRDLARITLRLAEGLDQDCDAKMAEFYDQLLLLIRGALDLGQSMGLVRPCDSRIVSQAALGSLKEVVRQWIVMRDSSKEEIDQVIHEILQFSMRGLLLPQD